MNETLVGQATAISFSTGTAASVPVIALGTGVTTLGVLRALGHAGIPAYAVSDRLEFVKYSRYCKSAPGQTHSLHGSDQLADFLATMSVKRAVLCPCTDHWVSAVSELVHSQPDGPYLASISTPTVIARLVDKGEFRDLLVRQNVPHPKTVMIRSEDDLRTIPPDRFAGSFLKPRDSQVFQSHFLKKAFRINNQEEAIERFHEASAHNLGMIFQEYIPGPATNHYFVDGFVDRFGRRKAAFARQRLRMYPRDFGNSTYMRSISVEQVAPALASLDSLLTHLGYRGIFSAEFKFDDRDGQYKLLEINARPWWYIGFAWDCGVDVTKMAWLDAQGMEVTPIQNYAVGQTCVYPYWDVNICWELRREGKLSVLDWARSWLTSHQPVFKWSDPMPWAYWMAQSILKKIRRTVFHSSREQN